MSKWLLEARGARKVFANNGRQLEVLKGVDLAVRSGEFVAITGPSGSGKSTLLYLLGALDRPSAGEVWLQGKATGHLSDAELSLLRNREVGFVFQFHFLIMELTAIENVMVPALISGNASNAAKERARLLLEQVGLGRRLDHRPAQLSGGEQQRVAIARALMNAPAVLLGDELTGNLDTAAGEAVFELLREHNRTCGQTMVVVTHNPELAQRADRIVRIVDGSISR